MDATPAIRWSLIIVVAGVVLAGFVFSAIGARLTSVKRDESRGQRLPAGSGIGVPLLIVLVIGGLLVSVKLYRSAEMDRQIAMETRMQQDAEAEAARREREAHEAELREAEETRTRSEVDAAIEETATTPAPTLPKWAQTPITIVENGEVDLAMIVAESQYCPTRDEAIAEAKVVAMATFQDRFAEDWPEVDSWTLPIEVFEAESIQRKPYVETRQFEIAGETEPAYRAFLQFEDSPKVREAFLTQWRSEVADSRAGQYALGLGGIGVALGLLSAALRGVLAISGQSSKPDPSPTTEATA